MKVSELIERLLAIKETWGDLEVQVVFRKKRSWPGPKWFKGYIYSVGISGKWENAGLIIIYGGER